MAITKKDHPAVLALFDALREVQPHANVDLDFSPGPVSHLVLIDHAFDADKLEAALEQRFTVKPAT